MKLEALTGKKLAGATRLGGAQVLVFSTLKSKLEALFGATRLGGAASR